MNIIFELQRNPFRKASPKLIDYFPLFIDSVLFDFFNRIDSYICPKFKT